MERQNFDAIFCGKQPLHDTNQIQPHGVVIVASKDDLRIIQVSSNFSSLFENHGELTGKPLSELIGADSLNEIKSKSATSTGSMPVVLTIMPGMTKKYLSLVHERDGYLIIETEFRNLIEEAHVPVSVFLSQLQSVMSEINRCKTITELAAVTARQIKRLSGFDKNEKTVSFGAGRITVTVRLIADGSVEFMGVAA